MRLTFAFPTLLNQALMFISSFIKEPGAGGEWGPWTMFTPKSARWVDLGTGELCASCGEEESQRN